jgi:hypothetical protein
MKVRVCVHVCGHACVCECICVCVDEVNPSAAKPELKFFYHPWCFRE